MPNPTFLAWYGAVMSTVSLILAAYIGLRDRARIGITVSANQIIIGDPARSNKKPHFVVRVANLGRRVVHIESIFLTRRDSKEALLLTDVAQQASNEIPEGKSLSYVVEQDYLSTIALDRGMVRDQAGRKWYSRIPRGIRASIEAAPKLASPGAP